mmetsp:Transcript_69546/g.115548  ORF Transcript_69546/g.115548 Transcript_69546/m.115548 type:complete len:232 (+) Transcript_69546:742-1437(+)
MARCRLDIPLGKVAMLSCLASHVKPKMPSGFPIRSPAPIPAAGATDAAAPAAAAAPPEDESGTAVFASAKSGMMMKVLSGDSQLMVRVATDSLVPSAFCAMARVERHNAAMTPATSALTPARSRHHHRPVPPSANSRRSELPERPIPTRDAPIAAAAPRKLRARSFAKQVARTKMAPRSSTVARVRRNAEADAGIRLRKKPYMAMAKAMSVAIGTVIAIIDGAGISFCTRR